MDTTNNRKINTYLFLFFLTVLLTAFWVNATYNTTFLRKFSEATFWLTVPILFFALVNFFIKNEAQLAWKKFTIYFFIISLSVILMTPSSTHGLDFLPIVKTTVSAALAVMYSVISLILISFKSLKKQNS